MEKKSHRRRKIITSKNRVVIVRGVQNPSPDYDKLAKALLEFVIEQRRQHDPQSVQWYYDKHPWLDRDESA